MLKELVKIFFDDAILNEKKTFPSSFRAYLTRSSEKYSRRWRLHIFRKSALRFSFDNAVISFCSQKAALSTSFLIKMKLKSKNWSRTKLDLICIQYYYFFISLESYIKASKYTLLTTHFQKLYQFVEINVIFH